MNVNLTENQLNEMLAQSTSNSEDNLLDEITSVDMQDGLIRVFGTVNTSTGKANGSYDFSMGQTGGDMWVEIVAIDIPGKSINDPSVTRMNNHMARDFAKMAVENEGTLDFRTVTITKDAVHMVVDVTIQP